jgi:hypothetical protein
MTRGQNIAPRSALSVEYRIDFGGSRRNRARKKPSARPKRMTNRLPRITRLLALAHHLQELIDQGLVADYADIARLSGITRARVTQIMNLTLLAPQIQEKLLSYGTETIFTHNLNKNAIRMALKTPIWNEQIELFNTLNSQAS